MLSLRYWKGILSITIGMASPFAMFLAGESSLKAAIGGAIIGGLTAGYNWIDQSLALQQGLYVDGQMTPPTITGSPTGQVGSPTDRIADTSELPTELPEPPCEANKGTHV